MPKYPIQYACRHCGGTDVCVDAWADWDVEQQRWTMGEAFPQAFCRNCEGETSLVEIALEPID